MEEYLVRMPNVYPGRVFRPQPRYNRCWWEVHHIEGEAYRLTTWYTKPPSLLLTPGAKRFGKRVSGVKRSNSYLSGKTKLMAGKRKKQSEYQSPFERVVHLYQLNEAELMRRLFVRRTPTDAQTYLNALYRNGINSANHIRIVWEMVLESAIPPEVKSAYNPMDALMYPDDQIELKMKAKEYRGENHIVFHL